MRKDKCFLCGSRKCCTRIVTPDFSFDEIACQKHGKELENCADMMLNGSLRCNLSSSGKLTRGEPYPCK